MGGVGAVGQQHNDMSEGWDGGLLKNSRVTLGEGVRSVVKECAHPLGGRGGICLFGQGAKTVEGKNRMRLALGGRAFGNDRFIRDVGNKASRKILTHLVGGKRGDDC